MSIQLCLQKRAMFICNLSISLSVTHIKQIQSFPIAVPGGLERSGVGKQLLTCLASPTVSKTVRVSTWRIAGDTWGVATIIDLLCFLLHLWHHLTFIRVKEGINLKSEMFISFINNHSTCCCCFSRLFGIFMDNDFGPSPLSLSIWKAKKKVSLGLWPNFCLFVAFQAIAFHDRLQSSRVPWPNLT